MREHRFDLSSVALDENTLASADCVVLVTDHDAFDYELIARHAPCSWTAAAVSRSGGQTS